MAIHVHILIFWKARGNVLIGSHILLMSEDRSSLIVLPASGSWTKLIW